MTTASPATSTGTKPQPKASGNPDWTAIPRSNGNTTSYTVQNLTNVTSYTLEIRALRGLEEGPSSSTSATTPDGPPTVPDEPSRSEPLAKKTKASPYRGELPPMRTHAPPSLRTEFVTDKSEPLRGRTRRSRQIDCCSATITGLRNRHHYEVQVSAVNRIGTSASIGPVNVTPQAPATEPPAPTGNADLNLGQIGQGWTTTGNNTLFNSCIGTKSFQIIWNGPDEQPRRADQWAAHINTNGGAGVVSYRFTRSPGQPEYYELNGTVRLPRHWKRGPSMCEAGSVKRGALGPESLSTASSNNERKLDALNTINTQQTTTAGGSNEPPADYPRTQERSQPKRQAQPAETSTPATGSPKQTSSA